MSLSVLALRPNNSAKRCYVKCKYCRHDKQKCTPVNRNWPSEKCELCIRRNRPCSKPSFARETADAPVPAPFSPGHQQSTDFASGSNMDTGFNMPYSYTSIVDMASHHGHSGSIPPSISIRDFANFAPPVHSDIEMKTSVSLEYLIKLVDSFIPQSAASAITGMTGMANVQPLQIFRLSLREANALHRRSCEMRKILKLAVKRRGMQQQLMMGPLGNGNFGNGFVGGDLFQVYPGFDDERNKLEGLYVFTSPK